jgi:heme/copper-type cytochrome/quinol oxidase subunit 3
LDGRVTERRTQLGMAMFLIAEAVFFFLLILACVYLRALPMIFDASGLVLTALLLASTLCVWRGWRWAAFMFGAVFVVLLFGTKFSFLTAVHGLFVFAGLISIAVVPVSGLRTVALYWYFFTAVWLFIFLVSRNWA